MWRWIWLIPVTQ
ncbi:Permeases of the major facilitator superfamily [Escherichia coli P12b]|nr:Permeases of the major facilitator superfamily [Escherichia coli P12b]